MLLEQTIPTTVVSNSSTTGALSGMSAPLIQPQITLWQQSSPKNGLLMEMNVSTPQGPLRLHLETTT
jgi:hypothetical protein